MKYDPKKIEAKWQRYWLNKKVFAAKDTGAKKRFVLVEFPYPSGTGLHMGHMRPFIAGDVTAKYWKLRGFNTVYPIGWDAFGLPAENFAIKNKVHPNVATKSNVVNAKKQLISWGTGYDWSREINTTDPKYYKWTQWLFLQFLKKGLAYEKDGEINWCPQDKTGLANEEVIDGKCERCGAVVEKRKMKQWYLRITDYAEKLLQGLDNLPEWPDPVKIQQRNWIGKSEGAQIRFKIKDSKSRNIGEVEVFTTRADTIFSGVMVILAPETFGKFLLQDAQLKKQIQNMTDVEAYIQNVKNKSTADRTDQKNKSGICLKGVEAVNPATGEPMQVWVADFVLSEYGTGAVFGDAHDERDFEIAKKYNIPLKVSVLPDNVEHAEKITKFEECYTGDGVLVNSGQFNGMRSDEARTKIIDWLAEKGFAKHISVYKLRDWVFSRQRYWGEPIPVVHCEKCGVVPVPEKDLPVVLPKVKNYEPTGTGDSPLAVIDKWVNTKCPKCKGKAKRETNTMPQWAGSSWYWLRYADPKNAKTFADIKKQKYWTPVDLYFGGMEHTTLHLLYSRFWNLFLYDQKLVTTKEPYVKRVPHGIILGPDGEKMSKSRGNVVNPDELVKLYGADTVRLYMLFVGPHGAQVAWNDKGIVGARRFVEKISNIGDLISKTEHGNVTSLLHKTIKKVSRDIENFSFNTAVSAMMILINEIYEKKGITKSSLEKILIILSPLIPHISEEVWQRIGNKTTVFNAKWPDWDPKLVVDTEVKIAIQINGKTRSEMLIDIDSSDDAVKNRALTDSKVAEAVKGRSVLRVIVVKNRLINIVIS